MSDYIFDYYLYGFNFNSQFWTTSWLYYVYDPGSEKSLVTTKPTPMYSDDLYGVNFTMLIGNVWWLVWF